MTETATQLTILNKDFYNGIQERFVELIDEKTFAKEVSFAVQHANKSPKLQECDRNSVLAAVMNVAQVGLTLNPVNQEAYLIPRWSKNGMQCVLEPSYQGLVKLVTDTGSVKNVTCFAVYEGDDFEVSLGTSMKIDHKPKFKKDAKITHVYAIAELPNGSKLPEVMTIEDCYDIRAKSESYKAWLKNNKISCPWVEWEQEMCRKCCIKRLVKYLPKTEAWEKIREAIALDNEDYELDPYGKQAMYISSLLENSILTSDERVDVEKDIEAGITIDEAKKLITRLENSQLDPVKDRGNPSATEAKKAVGDKLKDENE